MMSNEQRATNNEQQIAGVVIHKLRRFHRLHVKLARELAVGKISYASRWVYSTGMLHKAATVDRVKD
ncbi:MAG: hypothetical protein M1472_04570 [Planctomycetes bacterium]|nr:hypothetical protein [Planctomycetota bacterium]